MGNVFKRFLGLALVALILVGRAGAGSAAPPDRFVVFGDSLSDPGNAFVLLKKAAVPPFEPDSGGGPYVPDAPYAFGVFHFTNGPTWIEQLAVMGRALPTTGPALLFPHILSNYAVGGTRARENPADCGNNSCLNLSWQVQSFLGDYGKRPPSNALYVIWIGSNDVRDALQASSREEANNILDEAVAAIHVRMCQLNTEAQAKRFLVLNVPDLGTTPSVRFFGAPAQGAATSLSNAFNEKLASMLDTDSQTASAQYGPRSCDLSQSNGVRLDLLDVFDLIRKVVGNSRHYGLRNVEEPCIRTETVQGAYCRRPNTYLFWDGIHPTVAGHHIVAKAAKAVLDGPPALASSR